jgi:AcrR family transcriptional regulator
MQSEPQPTEGEPEPVEGDAPPLEEELIAPDEGDELLHRLTVEEMGERLAQMMRATRRAQEAWWRTEHPEEGLRERKRRLTRQLISDVATTLFATRGFDSVRVAEIADRVGVSEKTVYNYFPTKESMVLDTADEMVASLARALRERGPEEPLTSAVVRAISADMKRFEHAAEGLEEFIPLFLEMINGTPALRAAWLEVSDRLVAVAREELATQAGVDPRDPEPEAAARALVGLVEVGMQSQVRHVQEGLRGEALRETVSGDLERAARLLETGLWSFRLLSAGARAARQGRAAAKAAEEARNQVIEALRQARSAWSELRAARHSHPHSHPHPGEIRAPGRRR